METLQIEIYADIACPWCYIGERRLERALAELLELEVEWRWRPFQLQPQLPAGGLPWAEFARTKFGGRERARQMFAHVTSVGAAEGIEFDFDRIASAPNTADAHRLILCARRSGREREAADALFRAYFTAGANLNDPETLVALGEGIGLDPDAVRGYLQSERGREEVSRSQQEARRLGISGVPFYIFSGRVALSGAQPPEVFREAITMARREEAGTRGQ